MKLEDSVSISELSEKCQVLLIENRNLKEELRALKARLVVAEARFSGDEISGNKSESEIIAPQTARVSPPGMSKNADEGEKIRLFMSLFKGRDDVYARRWENKKKGTSGYSPSCLNEWKPGLCVKPKGKCIGCTHKAYVDLDEKVIDDHLRGKIVAGIYPMLLDETCWFLAIDFDDGEWKKDISVLREVCAEFDIPVSIERSRSGNGSHAWLFFKGPISASLARKFGTSLLTYTMQNRHEITFKSYDRFFPNQDTMPKGGLGNLIALPLQKEARKDKNSEFIDRNFEPEDGSTPLNLCLDAAYVGKEDVITSRYTPCPRGEEKKLIERDPSFKERRWIVELAHSWFNRFRKLVPRYEKTGLSYNALNALAAAMIILNKVMVIYR